MPRPPSSSSCRRDGRATRGDPHPGDRSDGRRLRCATVARRHPRRPPRRNQQPEADRPPYPARPAHEWRLVTITGRVASVHKLGDRWRAEITVGGKAAVVVGQPGAGIRARRSSKAGWPRSPASRGVPTRTRATGAMPSRPGSRPTWAWWRRIGRRPDGLRIEWWPSRQALAGRGIERTTDPGRTGCRSRPARRPHRCPDPRRWSRRRPRAERVHARRRDGDRPDRAAWCRARRARADRA
jgi:hypothetical protein